YRHQGHRRADRKVDPTRDHDQGHAQRRGPDDHRLNGDRPPVVRGQKRTRIASQPREQPGDQDQPQERTQDRPDPTQSTSEPHPAPFLAHLIQAQAHEQSPPQPNHPPQFPEHRRSDRPAQAIAKRTQRTSRRASSIQHEPKPLLDAPKTRTQRPSRAPAKNEANRVKSPASSTPSDQLGRTEEPTPIFYPTYSGSTIASEHTFTPQ